jgi:deoxycytidylate deaminase
MNNSERKRLSWEETALNLAYDIASYRSPDPYVQVGSVIIKTDNDIVLGYNGSPSDIEIDWANRDDRRIRVIHAEENALGRVKKGEVKFMAVTALPCANCLKSAANKGVKRIVYGHIIPGYDSDLVFKLAKEFGIELIQMSHV